MMLGPLELEILAVVSAVCDGTLIQVFQKNSQFSEPLSISPAPKSLLFFFFLKMCLCISPKDLRTL